MGPNDLETLLAQWEAVYKKGLLTLWLMLLLAQRKAYPYEMKAAIAELSQNTITAEENSIYRALKRLAQSGIVDSEIRQSETGPSRRYFYLTPLGVDLLTAFIERNIRIFQQPDVGKLLDRVTSPTRSQ
ncbi:MAG: PadR family transcriptional regulator [Anaerolineales bacterium]|nr:PadR family transcriptional regulator [Anaerolineales bacterium]